MCIVHMTNHGCLITERNIFPELVCLIHLLHHQELMTEVLRHVLLIILATLQALFAVDRLGATIFRPITLYVLRFASSMRI